MVPVDENSHRDEEGQPPGAKAWERSEAGADRNSDPPYESESLGKTQGTSHRTKGAHMPDLEEQGTHGEHKAIGKSHGSAHLDPSQCQEAAVRNEAGETLEPLRYQPARLEPPGEALWAAVEVTNRCNFFVLYCWLGFYD